MGIAAYKTVELDDSLGGAPIQFRECQNRESNLFLSYFKDTGIQYLEGGVASGFKHVERDEYPTRLLRVKGKRTARVNQVPCANTSLTNDDVFILDMGLSLYLFCGSSSNRMEKAKGADVIRQIKDDDRGGRAEIVFMDDEPTNEDFWNALGGQMDISANSGVSDIEFEQLAIESTVLIRYSDQDGTQDITPSSNGGALKRDLLTSQDVYILDTNAQVFVWIGKEASIEERRNGMKIAIQYLENNNRSVQTPITRVVENGETPLFKSFFEQWTMPRKIEFGTHLSPASVLKVPDDDIDVEALMAVREAVEEMVDDGSGSVQVWRIENFEKVLVPSTKIGQFYGGDSYIVLYTYKLMEIEHSIIYFWQGRDSSVDEKGASALLTVDLDDNTLGGKAVQVRVIQGKEPTHFRRLFKGKMIVHSGGRASGFKNLNDQDTYDTDGTSLYQIRGTNALNTCASQVEEEACNLNSGDCFVLATPETIYVWIGSNASNEEQEIAAKIAETYFSCNNVPTSTLMEGEESAEFWEALGGQTEYAKQRPGETIPQDPRLFECSTVTGSFDVTEIVNFAQDDLNMDDVYLLDAFTSLYLWIGSNANETEIRMAKEVADKYLTAATDGRDTSTPIVTVHCKSEPLMFTCNFLAWDRDFFTKQTFQDPYEARLAKLKAEKEQEQVPDAPGTVTMADVVEEEEEAKDEPINDSASFSLEQLKSGSFSSSVDVTKKETYLSDSDFEIAFEMSKAEFTQLPKWRQQAKKKQVGLF